MVRGLLVVALVLGVIPLLATPAGATVDEDTLVARLNDVRASRGLARLNVDAGLSDVARAWSGRMASAGVLSHNPALSSQVPAGWQRLGENVAFGASLLGVHAALVGSAPHLANMVDPAFNAVGIGVVTLGPVYWVTQVFVQAPVARPAAPVTAGSDWYRLVGAGGETHPFGVAPVLATSGTPSPIVAVAATASGSGTWTVAANGAVFAYGDAADHGSMAGRPLSQPIVGMAANPSGRGYWLVARDGGIFAFGDARFQGSTGAIRLAQPIVGMASSPTGNGYWFVAADGGVFAFGDARFLGSTGAMRLAQPVVGMASSRSGNGYWLVARDGGIFSFGDARFYGSTGAIRLNQPIVGMARSSSGNGYRFVAADGGIFSFGDAPFLGSAGGRPLASPIAAMVAGG